MKFDFENGLPVWVWGIAFFVLILPFSFRPDNDALQYGPNIVLEGESAVREQPASLPTATIPPQATIPIVIEVAPAPSDGYPEPELDRPQTEDLGQGYD